MERLWCPCGTIGTPQSPVATAPLTGEPKDAPQKSPLKGEVGDSPEGVLHGRFNLSPYLRSSTAVRPRVIARSRQSSDVAIRFPWQKIMMFHRTLGAAGQQSLPRRRKVCELRFRLWGEKLRSLPFARRKSPWGTPPFPCEPACAGLRRGPLLGGWSCVSKVWGIVPGIHLTYRPGDYSKVNELLYKRERPPGAISFVSRRKIWKKGVPKNASFFGISADCAANAFALTY